MPIRQCRSYFHSFLFNQRCSSWHALFNVYMDDLSSQLNGCNNGCLVGKSLINHLVILSPCSAGLQDLLKVSSQYGLDYDIKLNTKKSNIMIVRGKEDKKLT